MKIFSLIAVLLVVGSLSLGAQPKMDSLLTVQKAQIEAIGTDLRELQGEVKEHRIREGFYSDVLGAHGTWCGILIALLGAGIGFVSWSKVKNAKSELGAEFKIIMDEHNTQDNIVKHHINKDRIELRRLAGNLCIRLAQTSFEKKEYAGGLYLALDSIANGECNKNFVDTLDSECQAEMKSEVCVEKFIQATLERLQIIDKAIDEMGDAKFTLNRDNLGKRWKEFDELVLFFDEIKTNKEINHLRYNITYKLSPVFTTLSGDDKQ